MAHVLSQCTALSTTPNSLDAEAGAPAIDRQAFGAPPSDWVEDFDQDAFRGNPLIEEVLFFHRASRTVILDEIIQVHASVKGKPFRNALFRLEGVASPWGGVPIDIRLSFTQRQLARRSLERLLSWDFDRLIIGHGACIERDARPFVE